ncbi:unnamed protein product [Caenorhabditis bovis]|uniref:Protein kinase domain-containing protein n=1 Tax=Caenorhabditis bovis TaxID=2654633 RepID=A0A8S1ENH5_9PELO|nr:unnamed protein product [Caenorhabditis bovis]
MNIKLIILTISFWNLLNCSLHQIETPPFPVFGPCQRRCVKQFGELVQKTTNIDTIYTQVNVFNRTDFSLCKLGCNSPGYNDLHLPAFRYGQSAYQDILSKSSGTPLRVNVVRDVHILCLDTIKSANTTSHRNMTGSVLLQMDPSIDSFNLVHFVEIVARNSDDVTDDNILFQDWCYANNCNVTFAISREMENLQIRVRLSTFDDYGPLGGVVLSKWYILNDIIAQASMEFKLVDLKWRDDKAAAKLALDHGNQAVSIPKCTMQIYYKTALSSEFKIVPFKLDFTQKVLLKRLEFGQNYQVQLKPSDSDELIGSSSFDVPECRQMVDDMSMCAPPPVTEFSSSWNSTVGNGYALSFKWAYLTDAGNSTHITMSHFMLLLNPLITPRNEKCQKLEPIRRDITWTHRKVMFFVPDAECNYEAEIFAIDAKQRRSEGIKIKISRINEPSYMSLLLSNEIPLSIFFVIFVIFILCMIIITILVYLNRKKVVKKNVEELNYDSNSSRLVYAFVDANNTSRTVIGVRPLSSMFNSENMVPRLYAYNVHDKVQRCFPPHHSDMHAYYPYVQNSTTPISILNGPMATSTPIRDEDHPYETITDFCNESDISDDVFEFPEESSSPLSMNDSFKAIAQSANIPMPPFSLAEAHPQMKAVLVHELSITKGLEQDVDPKWKLVNVVDIIRGGSFSMKFGRNYSAEVKQAMKRELEIIKDLPPHLNCVRFDGLAITRWDKNPFQVVGLLFENCRGGTLRRYIHAVGTVLRRKAITSPNGNLTDLRSEETPSPPSSGYDSMKRDATATPDVSFERSMVSTALRFCQFSEQISAALEHLHRAGIVHTHVTTSCIYLFRDYDDPLDVLCDQMVKLGDFGNAATCADEVVVDHNLQPPEVAMGKRYEAKGDIWQLGTCLVEIASLGHTYQLQKEIPLSGVDEYDKNAPIMVIHEAARKCLNSRNRPSASDLRGVFQTDSTRNMVNLEQINQSLLV